MDADTIRRYCSSLKGVERYCSTNSNMERFTVGGKIFALLSEDNNNAPVLSLGCEPLLTDLLQKTYKDTVSGCELVKESGCSTYVEDRVPDYEIKKIIDISYKLVFRSLPKRVQEQILDQYGEGS